jgi:hypothetical protein
MLQFNSREEVESYLKYYFSKRVVSKMLEHPPYKEQVDVRNNLLEEAERFCNSHGFDFLDTCRRASHSVDCGEASDLRLYINDVSDIENYIRWMGATFPIKSDSSDRDFIWQTHCVQLEESLDYCFEHGINFMSVADRVNSELHADRIASNIVRFKKLFPHVVSEQAA